MMMPTLEWEPLPGVDPEDVTYRIFMTTERHEDEEEAKLETIIEAMAIGFRTVRNALDEERESVEYERKARMEEEERWRASRKKLEAELAEAKALRQKDADAMKPLYEQQKVKIAELETQLAAAGVK